MNAKNILSILVGVLLIFIGVYLSLDFFKIFFKFGIGLIFMIIGLYLVGKRT